MTQGSQQAIMHVLQQDSEALESVFTKLKQLQQIEQLLSSYLDSKLALHCVVANFEKDCITVVTDKAIWATQFRFQIPSLVSKLKQHSLLHHLKNMVCKIRPKEIPPAGKTAVPMPRLSFETANLIIEAASTIQDNKLKAIMQKIAKNVGENRQ